MYKDLAYLSYPKGLLLLKQPASPPPPRQRLLVAVESAESTNK